MTPEIPSQIILPQVPEDFNNGVGREFAQELLLLIGQAQIVLNPTSHPDTFDTTKLIQDMAALQSQVDGNHREVRKITQGGINNNKLLVTFPDMGTVDFSVSAMVLNTDNTDGTPPPAHSIYEVVGLRTTASVTLHCLGALAPYQIQVTIMESKVNA